MQKHKFLFTFLGCLLAGMSYAKRDHKHIFISGGLPFADTTLYIVCQGETVNLATIYDTSGYTVNWNTPTPQSAGAGNYTIIFTGSSGTDSVHVLVKQKITVWTGAINNDWHTANNWSPQVVPDSQTHVIVPELTRQCIISSADAVAASVQSYSGSSLKVETGRKITITSTCSILPQREVDSTDDGNMLMGNPGGATADTANPNNYLMVKPYYTLSYSRDRGTPNWVSWHIQLSDFGSGERQNNFRTDSLLPAGWYRVSSNSYNNSGFDRGHNCPSADRTQSVVANAATFFMTNIIPQAPVNNQQTWAVLEDSIRALVLQGNEVFVIMGSYGIGGTGSNGSANTINSGRVTVPAYIWKVIVVLPNGSHDLSRVTVDTRVIAVITPNINTTVRNWKAYRVSVDDIETATGLDLLSNVLSAVQQVIEHSVDRL